MKFQLFIVKYCILNGLALKLAAASTANASSDYLCFVLLLLTCCLHCKT